MFRTVPLSIIRSFHCTHSNGICHTLLQTACEQDQDGTSWSCSQAVCKSVWHIPLLCVQWKTPDDGQRSCPKHADFRSKNKFEKLVHIVGFIYKNLSWCTVTWTSNYSLFSANQFCVAEATICALKVKRLLVIAVRCCKADFTSSAAWNYVAFHH